MRFLSFSYHLIFVLKMYTPTSSTANVPQYTFSPPSKFWLFIGSVSMNICFIISQMLPYHSDSGKTLVADAVVFIPRYAGIRRNAAIAAASTDVPANLNVSSAILNIFL